MTFVPPTFDDFLKSNSPCKPAPENKESAERIWDTLAEPKNVAKMIAMASIGEPPLLACAAEIEALCENDNLKTVAGRMVREILRPYGFEPKGEKDFSKPVGKAATYVR